MNLISSKTLKLLFLLILIVRSDLKSGEVIGKSPKIDLEKLYESLEKEGGRKKLSSVKHWIGKKQLFPSSDGNGCSLIQKQSFGSVRYFSIACGSKEEEGLIH